MCAKKGTATFIVLLAPSAPHIFQFLLETPIRGAYVSRKENMSQLKLNLELITRLSFDLTHLQKIRNYSRLSLGMY